MAAEQFWLGVPLSAWHGVATILILMMVLVPSAIGDYQQQTIPNWLSMPGWLVGPFIGWLFVGPAGVFDALLGLGLMVGLLFPLWMIHWFGAADVKLMGSVGALVGLSDTPVVLLGVLLAGLVMSLVVLLVRKRLIAVLSNLMKNPLVTNSGSEHIKDAKISDKEIVIPYAIPIAFGTMLSILYLKF